MRKADKRAEFPTAFGAQDYENRGKGDGELRFRAPGEKLHTRTKTMLERARTALGEEA